MKTVTAREASRNFAHMLSEVESGESFEIMRNGVVVGCFVPPENRKTLGGLLEAMADLDFTPDPEMADILERVHADMNEEVRDPWTD